MEGHSDWEEADVEVILKQGGLKKTADWSASPLSPRRSQTLSRHGKGKKSL